MGTEAPRGRSARSPRPAGKRLTENRKAFMIYLPQSVHARLKAEATRRVVSMSELACTAVAQFLSAEEPSVPVPPSRGPFVGQYGQTSPRGVATPLTTSEDSMAEGIGQETFEVDD